MGFFLKKREGESQRREEGGGGRGRERERERERWYQKLARCGDRRASVPTKLTYLLQAKGKTQNYF